MSERDVGCTGLPAACTCEDGQAGKERCGSSGWEGCVCGPAAVEDSGTPTTDRMDAEPTGTGGRLFVPMGSGGQQARDAEVPMGDASVACGEQVSQADIQEERPVDVIFVIDNSGSMGDEISAVERNLNENFARIIEDSGADYRVIMLTDHGAGSLNVCIESPLASAPCSDTTSPAGSTAGAPGNSARFFHYDINVQSTDSVCLMLQHYQYAAGSLSPQTGAAASPTGWHDFLREGALKVFVEISDDRLNCTAFSGDPAWTFRPADATAASAARVARQVHAAILGLSSAQFGTADDPNFVWHSIVGIIDNDPPELPYTHFDPPRLAFSDRCPTAGNPGPAYQMLSISTAGLRYPVCAADEGRGFDGVFRAIAREVVRGSGVNCSFTIPDAPDGKFIDYASIEVQYTTGAGAVEALGRVKKADCDSASFYFEGSDINLCPAACSRVRTDNRANLAVTFQCGEETEGPVILE